MSLYNLIHGENPLAVLLLAMLDLDRNKVPRYRDCYWTGKEIAVHTRTGGGNRDYYDNPDPEEAGPWNEDLRNVPGFSREEDDEFDSTYATFYFKPPAAFAPILATLAAEDATPAQRWESFLGRLSEGRSDPQIERVVASMAPILQQIADMTAAPAAKEG